MQFKSLVSDVILNGNNMFWNKKNKNKSHIKREWSAEIGKLNYIIENMKKGIDKDWVIDELDDLYEIIERS